MPASEIVGRNVSPPTKPTDDVAEPRTKPADAFLDALVKRRTVYALTNKSSIPDERIVEIVQHSILHTPTSFNSQTNRAIILFGQNHTKLWDIVAESLRKTLPAERFEGSATRIRSFQAGYATILYFIDTNVVKELEKKFASYGANFVPWVESTGMLQSNVWAALAMEGVGASLQHYHNLIQDEVRTAFNVPEEWSLVAQQPIGVPQEGWKAHEKDFKPLAETVRVLH